MEKTTCWRAESCGPMRTVLRESRFKVKKMEENERMQQSVQFEEHEEDAKPDDDGQMEMIVKKTFGNIWGCDRGIPPMTRENCKVSRV